MDASVGANRHEELVQHHLDLGRLRRLGEVRGDCHVDPAVGADGHEGLVRHHLPRLWEVVGRLWEAVWEIVERVWEVRGGSARGCARQSEPLQRTRSASPGLCGGCKEMVRSAHVYAAVDCRLETLPPPPPLPSA